MSLADLLNKTFETDSQDVWENERTPTPVRRFGVRLHTARLSIRETVTILELRGVDRFHGAVWNWVHTLSEAQGGHDDKAGKADAGHGREYPQSSRLMVE